MRVLQAEAKRSGLTKSPWGNAAALELLDLDSLTEQAVVVGAPISKVQKVLAKPMKPGRDCLSVVRYKNGLIEEVTEKTIGLLDADPEPAEVESKEKPEAIAAVTVAAPTQGCPAPDFEAIDHRATRVLRAFLTPEQLRDFNAEQSFIQRGADTGHLYMVTSRNAPQRTRSRIPTHQSFRSLYDLTAGHALCVHDWTIPAAEEMLTLALFVATPGKESYVRAIPDDGREI